MYDYREIELIKQFFNDLSRYKSFLYGGLNEVVIDFFQSKYFDGAEQLDDLIKYVFEQSDNGRQVFFGPALRSNDLDALRSDIVLQV